MLSVIIPRFLRTLLVEGIQYYNIEFPNPGPGLAKIPNLKKLRLVTARV